ncbi:hypothetical protein Dsin_001730 [Dipteronia sinensis]|uniref:Sel1-like protein n=1 Tax=Dipteronia sinensis TaxID=43782 RepID=A0AAE0B669_9ROSI|nr:hypothetical protein Dsin_001730 [Dipteronia sinensis]
MGKSLPSSKLRELARIFSSSSEKKVHRPKTRHLKPPPPAVVKPRPDTTTTRQGGGGVVGGGVRVDLEPVKKLKMGDIWEGQEKLPLALVVSDCAKRWFHDTLKEARNGDVSMQILVGQMYFSGYGVARDAQKGRAWINRGSRGRSSVLKVSNKPPGYNASDSDSDELKGETK